jgi:predicted MPP superfamily phosphohydrolase
MGHAPDYMNNVLLGHVRREMLCVAGHTHGGQVNIPGFGPPITLSRVPRWLAAGGLHQRKGAWLLVSRGVGMERSNAPRIRFNCRPQLVVVTLVPAGEVALAPR